MFEHSEKPPREHKAAANILRRLRTEGGSLNRIVYQLHPRRFNVKSIYSLLVETVKLEKSLDEFFAKVQLLETEERLDPWLAKVLFTELILGRKQLPGTSKPVVTALRYYKQHKQDLDKLKLKLEQDDSKKVEKPRYVRVNTLLLSTSDAVRNFQGEGWNMVRCTSGSYDDYLKQLENLGEYDFIPDYHVKVVYAFPPKASFSECMMYNNFETFLQDKATCLAGHILAPTPGSTILDLCAAPGMKTTHLATIIKNEGTIYSVEQDEKRCDLLRSFVESAKATCVQVLNKDAAVITKIDCPNVDYVLVDPSCSGSGMDRGAKNDTEYDLESGRVKKLSAFQAKLLRHALNEFRTAKRIVYSTCSLYPQENEEVVVDVLKSHKGKYRLVSAPAKLNNKWNNVGDLKYYGVGEKCLYARPDSDYTCGFFIAVFERFDDENDELKSKHSEKKNKNQDNEVIELKIKKKHKTDQVQVEISDNLNDDNQVVEVRAKKIKKSKKNAKEICEIVEEETKSCQDDLDIDTNDPEVKKPKKRKHKDNSVEENLNASNVKKAKKKKNIDENVIEIEKDQLIEEVIVKKKKKKSKIETDPVAN